MAQEVVSRARNLSINLVGGAMHLAKSILPSTGGPPLATFTSIGSPPLPRLKHTICVVKGRAYLFGGETSPGTLADSDMHIVILPSSGVLQADYTSVPAKPHGGNELSDVPTPRRNHAAAVIGDDMYMFGGEDSSGSPVDSQEEHPGRVWVFDTSSNTWEPLDPPQGTPVPPARVGHAVAASEIPLPKEQPALFEPLPQQPMDPAKFVPDIPDRVSWGTLFVAGGRGLADGKTLGDSWAFDVKTRTWSELSVLPGPPRVGAGLAVAGQRLYRFGGFDGNVYLGGGIDSLDLGGLERADGTVATAKWEEIAYHNGQGPRDRSGAGLVPVTGAHGHRYLLVVGGEVQSGGKLAYFDDVWAFQLPADGSYEITKKIRGSDTNKEAWTEVAYQYMDVNGDAKKAAELPDGTQLKGMGGRGKFAVANGTEVDGASVVVWGGLKEEDKVCTDGWLIRIER